ncbi:hypothetical protein [Hugenholtzia roseola]|uniref:hypothetical protein n=1 Tax=Hugenholtzia roseola TaxID=1002 RepID=UPI0013779A36|nr:hypothetical protein [Hugenholtzia roseola]
MNLSSPTHPVWGKQEALLKEADKVEVFLLEETPTHPKEQQKSEAYFADFRILERYTPADSLFDTLRLLLSDTTQFELEQKKSCPMQAQYGICFSKKKKFVGLVISKADCPKSFVVSSEKDLLKKPLDLVLESRFYPILDSLTQKK